MEARLERRRDWAESRDRKSDASFNAARSIADNIPLGQPILVGHHSERHARRDAARIDNGMRKGVESMKMAERHRGVAGTLAHQLETTIFSDDPDAIDALKEKIAKLEARRESLKAINAAYRKAKGAPGWSLECMRNEYERTAFAPGESPMEKAWANLKAQCPWEKKPVPTYELTNLGANIRRLEDRVKVIEARAEETKQAEAAGGLVIRSSFKDLDLGPEDWDNAEPGDYCTVTFAEKPARKIIDELKGAGYHWCGSHWSGKLTFLPACVKAMALEAQPARMEESR
jgi:hypothetical protein